MVVVAMETFFARVLVIFSWRSAVVEKTFDAAETRYVVDTRIGRAKTFIAAQPLGRQRSRSPTRLATTTITFGTDYRIVTTTTNFAAAAAAAAHNRRS